MRPGLDDERGAALPTALLAVAVLAVLAASAATLGAGATRSAAYWPNHAAALYVAESGLNEALYRLDNLEQVPRRTYPADPPSLTSAPGLLDDQSSYQVWVQDAGGSYVLVTARGTRAGVSRVVQVRIRLARPSLFFDPDGDGIIRCSDTPRPSNCDMLAVDFTVPDPPQGTGPGGKLDLKKKKTQSLGPGTYAYSDVWLGEDAALTITGPATIYVAGDIRLGKDARLTIAGPVTFYLKKDLVILNDATVQVDGTTEFYIGDSVSFGNGSSLTSTAATAFYVADDFVADNSTLAGSDPTMLTVLMSTTGEPKVELKNDSVFNGGIYAPTAAVEIKNDARLTGAVVGYTVQLKNDATVTYDPNVSGGGDGGTGVVGGSWGEL